MAGLEDAAIDAAAEMLDEGAEQPRVGGADREIAVERTSTLRMVSLLSDVRLVGTCGCGAGDLGNSTASSRMRIGMLRIVEHGARVAAFDDACPCCMIMMRSLM